MRRRSDARAALQELYAKCLLFDSRSSSIQLLFGGFVAPGRVRFRPLIATPSVVSLPVENSDPPTSTMPSQVRFEVKLRLLSAMTSPRPSRGIVKSFLIRITGQYDVSANVAAEGKLPSGGMVMSA